MFIVIAANVVGTIILALFDLSYLYSFEVAFFGSMAVVYSSYKSMLKKVQAISNIENAKKDNSPLVISKDSSPNDDIKSNTESIDSKEINDDFNISKKDRLLVGFRISFGIFRICSYAFIAIGVVSLINNKLFFIIPFLFGVCICSFAMAFAISKSN